MFHKETDFDHIVDSQVENIRAVLGPKVWQSEKFTHQLSDHF